MSSQKYLNKDDFVKRLKGVYVNWPKLFGAIVDRNNLVVRDHGSGRQKDYKKVWHIVDTFLPYYGTETDVDWRNVTCRLLFELGEADGNWSLLTAMECSHPTVRNYYNGTPETKGEAYGILLEILQTFDEWLLKEVNKEGKLLPQWYLCKLYINIQAELEYLKNG